MSNDGSINVDYGLDASRASAELKKLQADLQGVTANLLQAQKVIETRTERMIAKLGSAMEKINAGSANYTRNIQKQEAAVGQALGAAGRGGLGSQINEAGLRSVIADAKATSTAITARLTDELIKNFSRDLRSAKTVVDARIRAEINKVNNLVSNNSPQYLAAQNTMAGVRRGNVVSDANNPALLDARAAERAARTAALIDRVNDAEYLSAQAKLARIKRIQTIEAANNVELLEAKSAAAATRNARLIERVNDSELISAESKLARIKRIQTIETANDTALLDARHQLQVLRNDKVITQANDAELLAAQEKLRVLQRQRTIDRANNPVVNDPALLAAQNRAAGIRRGNVISDANNPALLDARAADRSARTAALIDRVNDAEYLSAQNKLARIARLQTIEAANNIELLEAKAAASSARNARLIDRVNDSELISAETKLARVKRLQTIETARNDDLLAARQSAQELRNSRVITQANDAELLAAQNKLRAANRQNTINKANNLGVPVAPTVKTERDPFARFESNGGADIIGIQSRLLIGYAGISAAFGAARSLTHFVIELDKELTNFQAISTATNGEMVTMKDTLIDLSRTVPFTTVEMVKAATTMSQAGLSTREVADSIGAVARFATASGSDLASSVDIITSSLSAFNLQTSQTGHIADVFTTALNLSKLNVTSLVTAMSLIAPTAESMGISLEGTVSLLGALSQSGIKASTMGTGLRQLLVDLQEPSKKFQTVLKQMGLTQDDVNVKSQGFLGVMEKLKEAGFGSAQAFEAFELRAAASFTALQNNLPLAYEMQKSFILSNAALEATNIQMSSLSNTAKNFYSVFGGLAYTTFSPVVETLQKILSGATSILGVLTQFPAVLNAIGVALAVIGTATAIGVFVTLARGLTRAIPLLSTFASGWKGVAVGVEGTTGAVGGLFAVMKLNPWTAALSIVLGLVTAFYSFGTAAETATSRIEALQERVNTLRGDTDAATKKMEALDNALEGVINQKDALDKNPLMRDAKILELQVQFRELGGTIVSSTASVTDLIRELHNLKGAQQELKTSALGAQLESEKNLETERRKQISDYFSGGADQPTVFEALAKLLGRDKIINPNQGVDDTNLSPSINTGVGLLNGRFNNPSVSRVTSILGGDRSQLNESNPMAVASLLNDLDKQKSQLIGSRSNVTDPQALAQIDADIEFLGELYARFGELNKKVADLGSAAQNAATTEAQLKIETVKDTPSFKKLGTDINSLNVRTNSSYQDILSSGKPDADKIDALNVLRNRTRQEVGLLQAARAKILKEALAKDPTLNAADADAVVKNEVESAVAPFLLTLTGKEDGLGASLQKFLDKQFKTKGQAYKKEMDRLSTRRSDSLTKDELDTIENSAQATIAAQAEFVRKYYQDQIGNTTDDQEKDRLTESMNDALTEMANQAEDAAIATVKRANDLLARDLKSQQDGVQDSMSALSKKIAEATELLKTTRPGTAMDTLIANIKAMIAEFARLGKMSNSLQLQQDVLSTSQIPIDSSAADRAAQAMALYLSKGYSKNASAGLIGNFLTESNLDPNAQGDFSDKTGRPSAFGVAQHRFDRWDALKASTDTPFDLNSQLDFIDQEIQTKFPELYKQLQDPNISAAEAARLVMDQYEKPNKDPAINHIDKRVGYANTLANGDFSAQQGKLDTQTKDLDKATADAVEKATTASMDAQIKKAKANLGLLSTQVKIADTTESIDKITEKVKAWHAEIMKAELAKFDAKNVEAAKTDPEGIKQEREDLKEKLRAALATDIAKIQEQYYTAATNEIEKPVDEAKLKLDVAQRPENAAKYTQSDILGLENNVRLAEREALLQKIKLAENEILAAKTASAAADEGSPEKEAALEREAELKARLVDLTKQKNIEDAATASQGPSVASAIQSATQQYLIQAGVLQANGKDMVPLAQQVGEAWSGILDSIGSGMQTLFMDLATGTKSAGEAFKAFGLSVVQSLMSAIAKALALQIIMSMFGGTGGGGMGSDIISGLLGVVGMSLGGGVKGAALGEMIQGNGNRDGVLRKLMPGEFVLRQSAVSAIGADKLDGLNNLGNATRPNDLAAAASNDNAKGPTTVNVWVVSQDNVPPPSPTDIIATVADNIQRRGSLKTLIQQVVAG